MSPILLSPDGIHYLRAAEGLAVPSPYQRRWLLPKLLGPHPYRWRALTWASLALTPVAAWCYFADIAPAPRLFAVALLCAIPALRLPWRLPVLTDAPAFAGALAVAALTRSGHPLLAVILSLPLGATRETAPAFAALWAWHPAPLLGLLAAGWWRRTVAPSDAEPWLAHPWREAWALRRRIGLDASLYVRPWGAALLGLTGAPSWQVTLTVVVAHAQLLCAVDTLRLAAWCAPVVVGAAAKVVPAAWWVVAIVVTAVSREDRA